MIKGNKGIHIASVFNPENFTKMDLGTVKSYLNQLESFDFVTRDIIDDAVLELDWVFNHARSNSILPGVYIKYHSIMQKSNVKKEDCSTS